jgi:hypothetical protein
VLATNLKDFKQYAEILARVAETGDVVVLGSADAIVKAGQENGKFKDVKKVM